MKRFLYALLGIVVSTLGLSSCEKEENKVYFEGGTAPVLTASATTPVVLLPANAAQPAMSFSWTNPNYNLNTGTSSQNVNYTLEVDSAGRNFSSAMKQEISIANDLTVAYNVKDLNSILTRMNLQEDKAHGLEFRIRSNVAGTGAGTALTSNVVRRTITPYLDVAVPVPPTGQLFVTGNAMPSDWTNTPPATQQFTKKSTTEYEITVALTPGKLYKFLSTPGNWQPQYGGKEKLGGDLGFNMGSGSDPDAIPTPDVAANYKITVNFKTGKYTVIKQ